MKRTVLFFLLLAAAFDFLFWAQTPGLNVFLFSILVVAVLYWRFKEARKRIPVAVLAAGTLLSGFMVFAHGAGWALAANVISLLLFAVAISTPQLRSVYYFIPQSVTNLVFLPVTIASKTARIFRQEGGDRRFIFYFFVIGVPLVIGAVFYALYLWGSPHFREANSALMDAIENYFGKHPVQHVFFLLWALSMSGYFLFRGIVSMPAESALKRILRVRKPNPGAAVTGLKREMQAGIVLLLVLNVLIAVVNCIDIKTVWFDFRVPEHFSLKQFVHNGTWILIMCVFLSVGIVLWLFRGNQNHFWKSWLLRLLAVAWIAQNMVLTFSVFMRNYHYIGWHGLAYGRIFVIVLLLMTMIALVLLMLKVTHRYTGRYFFAVNSWIAYTFVIACSFVNWDRVIFDHNIAHRNVSQIDYAMYATMGVEIYPEIYRHKAEIDTQLAAHARNAERWIYWESSEAYWNNVRYYRKLYFYKLVFQEWQSWTIAGRSSLEPLYALQGR
jgi:hypothetical protein